MVRQQTLTEYIKDNYYYESGELKRKFTYKQWAKGSAVGTVGNRGYKTLSVMGKRYYVHRLIFLLLLGELPEMIDHIDGDKTNNSIDNLRPSTKVDNALNLHKPHCDNNTGVLGVYKRKDNPKFDAKFRGKYLGSFSSIKLAEEAYIIAKLRANESTT